MVYLNEQKAKSLSEAAVLADGFVLTHRPDFAASERPRASVIAAPVTSVTANTENCKCFYCHTPGHIIAFCPVLKRKADQPASTSKGIGLIKSE